MGYDGLVKNGAITIVAFGDSVTHGAVTGSKQHYDTVYHSRLRDMIYDLRDYVPINVINAGIGGITASNSIDRIENQVTSTALTLSSSASVLMM